MRAGCSVAKTKSAIGGAGAPWTCVGCLKDVSDALALCPRCALPCASALDELVAYELSALLDRFDRDVERLAELRRRVGPARCAGLVRQEEVHDGEA